MTNAELAAKLRNLADELEPQSKYPELTQHLKEKKK